MNNKKISIIFILIAIGMLGLIGVTLALYNGTDTLDNIFTSAIYQTKVTEVFTSPSNWKPGDVTPKTLTVQNTGNIPVKVRVKMIESWESEDGTPLPLRQNGERVSLINLDNTTDWVKDGLYYYYQDTLDPNEVTSSFIQSVQFNPHVVNDYNCVQTGNSMSCDSTSNSYDGGKYILTFQIETIQEDFAETVWDHDEGTLYGIVKNEYTSNSGYAALYTGTHQDSYDRESTKNIYYYKTPTSDNEVQGNNLLNKMNVLFAGYCWQMIRTTDTGGVKMIYNGVPVDGECSNTRANVYGITQNERTANNSMNGVYAYGSDFTYDLTNRTFKITGTIKENTNYVNDKSVVGMYTCRNSNPDATCNTLYYIHEENPNNANNPYVYPFVINSINYSFAGVTPYNTQNNSLAHVGYMYNKTYESKNIVGTTNQSYTAYKNLMTKQGINTNWYYADSVDMGTINAGKYTLINPTRWETGVTNLSGKYAMNNAQSGNSVFYIEAIDGTNVYTRTLNTFTLGTNNYYADEFDYVAYNDSYSYVLTNPTQWTNNVDVTGKYVITGNYSEYLYCVIGMVGNIIFEETLSVGIKVRYNESIAFSDTYTDNLDGTYTLDNPTYVSLTNYYTNYANYVNKYTCGYSNITCTSLKYTVSNTSTRLTYVDVTEKMLIAKSRSGLELQDTMIVNEAELVINRANYGDYKYTCNSTSSTCTSDTLRMIVSFNSDNYTYAPYRFFGESVTWNGTYYTLNNALEVESATNITDLTTHHYTCVEPIGTQCTSVGYIYNYPASGNINYILLENGVETVSQAIIEMLYEYNINNENKLNTKDSPIKRMVEEWYYNNMLAFDNYLEETIYCNNRSIRDYYGWSSDGIPSNNIKLSGNSLVNDLSCSNETDQFSVLNDLAKLRYKVGLISVVESDNINNKYVRKVGDFYWTITPYYYNNNAVVRNVNNNGGLTLQDLVHNRHGARPVISLVPGIVPTSGSGTMANPYVIDVEPAT